MSLTTTNQVQPFRYFTDDSCIDCDLCRETAPEVFRRDDDEGVSVVWNQPSTPKQLRLAEEARGNCPTETIQREETLNQ